MGALRWAAMATLLLISPASGQDTGFRWVNPLPQGAHHRLEHGIYVSELMQVEVGYVVYRPPGYGEPENAARSYPVVYHLTGGRAGNESRSAPLADLLDPWILSGEILPRIVVFVNGGPEGYFDYGDSRAESSLIGELIPHIDAGYRTFQDRAGRAVEGFSMGGRAAARIAFKHPELFCSAVSLSGGHQREEMMSRTGGKEDRGTAVLEHDPENNSWDLARLFAEAENRPDLHLLVAVGTVDPNYQGNLDWMAHLRGLGITFEERILPEVPHDLQRLVEALGPTWEAFHDRCFSSTSAKGT